MAPILYKRQRQIVDFIQQFIQSNGTAPTLRQIADAIGVSSLATVHEHLASLENKGVIKRKTGKTRAIELVDKTMDFISEKAIDVPILGYIAAGKPIEPYTDPNATMTIGPAFVSSKKRVYVLQVKEKA